MRYFTSFALLGGTLALSACAASPRPDIPERSSIRLPQASIQQESKAPILSTRPSMTSGTMTLDGAIETALLNNPKLQADFAAFEAAALEVPQASSLMDPRVTYTRFVEGVQTRTGEQQFVAGVSQMFPWFGKRRLLGDIERSKATQSLESYRISMLDIREQVQSAWYSLAYEQAAQQLAFEDKATIERSLDAAASLYGSGQQGRGSLLQAQTEVARIENELSGYPARIEGFQQNLAQLLFVNDPGTVSDFELSQINTDSLPSAEHLIAEAINLRPEIERFRLSKEQAELAGDLAQKDYYPDLNLGLNYVGIGGRPDNPAMSPSDEGDDAWGVSVGFNIPIPNARRRAAKEQALRQQEEAEWRRIAAESEIEAQVRSILPRLTAINQQLGITKDNLMPLAEEAYATNESSYTSGDGTFLNLLDAQRTLIAVRRDQLILQRDYLLTITELERVVGGSLTEVKK